MIAQWLDALSIAIQNNFWIAPLFALLAGVLTSFTPCALSSVPLIIGYVGGYAGDDVKRAFRYSLVFCVGLTITFTALGTAASLMGRLMQTAGSWWYIVLGVLMVLMALQTFEIINIIPQSSALNKNKKKGYVGAVLMGMLGGLFASPCATPVLIVLLTIVAHQGNLVWGIVLLLIYSAGHSVLIMIAGTSVGFVKKLSILG